MSKITKRNKIFYYIFSFLSFVVTLGPLLYYIINSYLKAELTREKVTLSCMVICAIILVLINIFMKRHIRSTIWLLLLGIYVCIENILPLLLMIACGTIIDEFIITPLKNLCKSKYKINKEIDRRL